MSFGADNQDWQTLKLFEIEKRLAALQQRQGPTVIYRDRPVEQQQPQAQQPPPREDIHVVGTCMFCKFYYPSKSEEAARSAVMESIESQKVEVSEQEINERLGKVKKRYGICCRYPPKIVDKMTIFSSDDEGEESVPDSVLLKATMFPMVKRHQGCGEYKQDQEKMIAGQAE